MCRITKTGPSFLLHPLDFIGSGQVPELSFFPGMDESRETKINIFRKIVDILKKDYRLVEMRTCAAELLKGKKMKILRY